MRKNNGITLIALVVTIIVLIILAAVSLNMLLGQNGIITKAGDAAKGTKVESGRELIAMAAMASYDNTGRLNKTDLATELNKIPGIVQGDSYIYPIPGFPLDVTLDGTTYQIQGDGKVTGGESAGEISAPTDEKIADLVKNDNTGEIKIGDYVKYTPTEDTFDWSATENGATYATYSGSTANINFSTQTDLNWRVLDITDNGQVRLISDAPTTDIIALKSNNGYNNAVYLLDKICSKLYSRSGVSEKVQNLKIEDIEKYITYDYTQSGNSICNYGSTREYLSAGHSAYPSIFKTEITGWVDGFKGTINDFSQQDSLINQIVVNKPETNIEVTMTYWHKTMEAEDFKNYNTNGNIYYKLFINNNVEYPKYWLSSRCVIASETSAGFLVRCVRSGYVIADYLYYSYAAGNPEYKYGARPVITLKSDVKIDMNNKPNLAQETSSTNCWKLK